MPAEFGPVLSGEFGCGARVAAGADVDELVVVLGGVMENFAITGGTIAQFPDLVCSMAAVKQAAAANRDLALLPPKTAEAIIEACKEIRAGGLADQFTVDPVQGGAGTSTNMNADEVIANRALELLGHPRGDVLHPLEHVNLNQSTNDVYPTAVRLALVT
ncbi:MAG: hypothetical protein HOV87_15740, partial [Catenulispora sp.]|nr:hypothetical protein [Catenulispora sp.]